MTKAETIRERLSIDLGKAPTKADAYEILSRAYYDDLLVPVDEAVDRTAAAERKGMEMAAVIAERPTIASCCCADGIAAAIRADMEKDDA